MSGVITDAAAGVRADVWLWAARFFKTRALAKQAIETGKLGIDGQDVAKPSRLVRCGQRLRVERAGELFEIDIAASQAGTAAVGRRARLRNAALERMAPLL